MTEPTISNHDYPIGYYDDLHPDVSLNFTMNRFHNWTNDPDMLAEMRQVSPQIHGYKEFVQIFTALGEKALNEKKLLKAAFYLRGAEFYIPAGVPLKQQLRQQFVYLTNEYYQIRADQHFSVPYEGGSLSAYRFTPSQVKGTIVFCGGYDSYIEELIKYCLVFRDAGYDIIAFEGPGQGGVLEDEKIPLTHEVEKPVKAVLDYFKLDDVTIIGLSMGGYFAVRAAAFEPRIKRVIADDVFSDAYAVIKRGMGKEIAAQIDRILEVGDADRINTLITALSEKSLLAEWGLKQGMHITGKKTPYDFILAIQKYATADFSARLTQDVLLLAGQEDHYVPVNQLYEQAQTLTNVRSLTTRLFTRREQGQNHCQVGNVGLSLDVKLAWLHERALHTNSEK